MKANTHTFSVSEIFPDGRGLVFTYARIGDRIGVSMVVYDDLTMTSGKSALNPSLVNGRKLEISP